MQAILDHLAHLPDVFLFVTLYHSNASSMSRRSCSNRACVTMRNMSLQNSAEVISILRERLEPAERADSLADAIKVQYPPARTAAVLLGVLPPGFTAVSNFVIMPVVAFLPRGLGTLQLQEAEVTELILASLHGLANPAIFRTEQWTRSGMTHSVYFYEYGPYTIWGATARMLNALLQMLGAV